MFYDIFIIYLYVHFFFNFVYIFLFSHHWILNLRDDVFIVLYVQNCYKVKFLI